MKKAIYLLAALALSLALTSCGKKEENISTGDASGSEGTFTGGTMIPNPMQSIDFEDFQQVLGKELALPEDAEDIRCYCISGSEASLYELMFIRNGNEYCYRFQKTDEFRDISGMYYNWDQQVTQEEPRVLLSAEGAGMINWYEDEMSHSLSMPGGADKELLTDIYYKLK